MSNKTFLKNAVTLLLGATLSAGVTLAQAGSTLKVYTAIEADDLKRYAEEFNKQ